MRCNVPNYATPLHCQARSEGSQACSLDQLLGLSRAARVQIDLGGGDAAVAHPVEDLDDGDLVGAERVTQGVAARGVGDASEQGVGLQHASEDGVHVFLVALENFDWVAPYHR